jgi:hypothetical protein
VQQADQVGGLLQRAFERLARRRPDRLALHLIVSGAQHGASAMRRKLDDRKKTPVGAGTVLWMRTCCVSLTLPCLLGAKSQSELSSGKLSFMLRKRASLKPPPWTRRAQIF